MKMYCVLAVVFVVAIGCEKQGTTMQANQVQQPPAPTMSQPDSAKAHLQQFVDRLMGGDESVKVGLLGLAGISLERLQ